MHVRCSLRIAPLSASGFGVRLGVGKNPLFLRTQLGCQSLAEVVGLEHIETRFDADGAGTLMTMRMTLPDAATRAAMPATGMEHGMEASYERFEAMT